MIKNYMSHYKIIEKLGAGGMGEVFLAEDTRLGRKVALKMLPASYLYDPERRARFLREARAASALNSPNVVAIYDIGESDDAMFIAMEYVEGELLSNKLEAGPIELYLVIDIATQISEALEQAHSLGIIHRDIKSSNVIVTPKGLVKVLDFGLAKKTSPPSQNDDQTVPLNLETAPGVILGTVAYMSPEQARGLEVDSRTDLFSLGVLLYEMLMGKRPFEGATTGDLLVSILSREPDPIVSVPADIPPEMQWVVSKALRKDKTLRYQTARDFIIDLKNLRQGLTTRLLAQSNVSDTALSQIKRQPAGSAIRDTPARRRPRKQIDSIAVLPLVNATGDPDIEYLSDGITESLINALSQIPKLRVMARSTVFRYKNSEIDAQQIGLELNVRAVMTGRLRKVRDHFWIGAELVDVTDGSQLWGEQYTKQPSDILSLQEEVSSDIGEKLMLKLKSGQRQKIARQRPKSAEAYELYLKGRYHWGKFTVEGLREATALFEQALAKDPAFALAYSGLGAVYGVQSYLSFDPIQSHAMMLKAKASSKRALEIDDALPDAHLLLANIAHLHDWDLALAEREFKIALELNPNLAEARLGYSLYLMDRGLIEKAMTEMQLALELDPLSFPVNTSMGFLSFNARQYDDAISHLRRSLQLQPLTQVSKLDPLFQLSQQLLGACFERTEKYDEAVTEYLRMIPEWARSEEMTSALRSAYAEFGMKGFWRKYTDYAQEMLEQKLTTLLFVSTIYASLEEPDRAVEFIERAFDERSPALIHIKVDPRLENLHSDSRFTDLLRRMGLSF